MVDPSSSTMAYPSRGSTAIPAISLKLLGAAAQNGQSPLDLLLANPIRFVKASVMSPVYNRPEPEKFADTPTMKRVKKFSPSSGNTPRVTVTKEYKILPSAPNTEKAKPVESPAVEVPSSPLKRINKFEVVVNRKDKISPTVSRQSVEKTRHADIKINGTETNSSVACPEKAATTNGESRAKDLPNGDCAEKKIKKIDSNGEIIQNQDFIKSKQISKKRKAEEQDGPTTQKLRKDIDQQPKKVMISPKVSNLKSKGFHNRLNDCYRNSVLQLICSIPEFEDEISKHDSDRCKISACVCCYLGELIGQHHFESKSTSRSKTNDLVKSINTRLGKVLPKQFRGMRQEDATEYLHAVLHACKDQLSKRIKDAAEKGKRAPKEEDLKNNPIDKTFDGSFPSVLTCPKCGHRSFNRTDLPSLMLIPSVRSNENRPGNTIPIKNLLEEHFKPESVDATCEKCKFASGAGRASAKTKFTKQVEIERLPRVLILNVVRWTSVVMNRGTVRADKIMNRLKYDEKMTLREQGKPVNYRLISVVAHGGRSLSAGHYICFVRQPDGKWAMCNDSYVDEIEWDIVARADGMQAAILGYQRID